MREEQVLESACSPFGGSAALVLRL